MQYAIERAEQEVRQTYSQRVSVQAKSKSLNKFGRSANADTGVRTTVAQFPGTVVNETYVSTNIVDAVVSSSASDTMTIRIEGHTIDTSGNLTFVVQDATLNGQTEVALATPLARATRLFIKNSGTFDSPQASVFVGNISVYDNTDGITAGVPNTDAAVKLYVVAGQSQSRKAATAISSVDYWFLTSFTAAITGGGPAADVEFQIEIRDVANGGVFLPLGAEISLTSSDQTTLPLPFLPLRIVPPNHDVRIVATSSANNTQVSAGAQGYLASVL